jgi:hypothetical protein
VEGENADEDELEEAEAKHVSEREPISSIVITDTEFVSVDSACDFVEREELE